MSSSLPPFPFVILDTETTGFFPKADRILELALMRFEGGQNVAEYESLYTVEQEIPAHVQVITRIRPEHLHGKPPFASERENIVSMLRNAVIVGHNILFDLAMLQAEGISLEEVPWVDTAMLASLVFPELESWSLGYLSTVLHLPHEPPHRALGDVRATLALLESIVERLEAVPPASLRRMQELAARGPAGYRELLSSLKAQAKEKPPWLLTPTSKHIPPLTLRSVPCVREAAADQTSQLSLLSPPEESSVTTLVNAPLSPWFLPVYGEHLPPPGSQGRTWVTVKNLRAACRILPASFLEGMAIIHPASVLLHPAAKDRFLAQPTFTADELTVALKVLLYEPETKDDLPLHSEENDVWDAKLACSKESPRYLEQFGARGRRVLIEHRELLALLSEGQGPQAGERVIVDDASMLEDTATKAFRRIASLALLRAGAAEGEPTLTRFLDILELWLGKVRRDLTIRYLVETDLRTPDVQGLRERLEKVPSGALPENVREQLNDLRNMLDPKNLEGRITWIEQFRDGTQLLQSVPLDIASLLWEILYDRCTTTLLLPPGERKLFSMIVSPHMDVRTVTFSVEGIHRPPIRYAEPQLTLEKLLPRVDGKTIVLIASKRTIEQYFVRFAERLEEAGITLLAQGLSGGLRRMQAEFVAAEGPAVWLLTPWMYEGVELPCESVDHLWIATLPFDHPSQVVLSRRAERHSNPFEGYFFPRLLHRLFRLLRTYELHRKSDGSVLVLDERIHTRAYGEKVRKYLAGFTRAPSSPFLIIP